LIVSTSSIPSDLWLWEDGEEHRLTEVNRSLLAERVLGRPARLLFDVEDDVRIEGWLILPVNGAQEPFPLIAHVHRGRFGHTFRPEFQMLAAAGFAVLYVNCRGGYGYGQAFREAIHYRPLTKEYDDIRIAVEKVLRREDIDQSRVGITGTSYGGKLTNWFLAKTSLFRAGVSRAGIANQYSAWGSSDRGYLRWIPVGPPWSNPEFYLEASPLTFVEGIDAPLLFLHGDRDSRCVVDQSEQLYRALKFLGRTTEMVIFHGASHGLERSGKPKQRYEFYRRILEWFGKYLA
jgi:dipeptidyl aminopeptidase/acylaminoacyl peptidase